MVFDARIDKTEDLPSYTQYIIACSADGDKWQCKKRYSELSDLHNQLKARGAVSAHFPPKKFFGNRDQAFVQQRLQQLDVYIRAIGKLNTEQQKFAMFFFDRSQKPGATASANHSTQQAETNASRQEESGEDPADATYRHIVQTTTRKFIDVFAKPTPLSSQETSARQAEYWEKINSSDSLPSHPPPFRLPKPSSSALAAGGGGVEGAKKLLGTADIVHNDTVLVSTTAERVVSGVSGVHPPDIAIVATIFLNNDQ